MNAKKMNFFNKVKSHKTELVITGTIITGMIGTAVISQNYDAIHKAVTSNLTDVKKLPIDISKQTIFNDFSNKSTGNELTATKLGHKVGCSAQEINKRIVDKRLAIKLPNGQYELTEFGKAFGKHKNKTRSSGYQFSNIEWEEEILKFLFTPEELSERLKH